MTKPANVEFKSIFDNAASQYDAVTNTYAVERRKDILVQWANGDCLEVGAGTGEISKALLEKGHNVVATDISSKMVKEIQRKLGIKTYVCDAEKLPFPDSSFDTIVAAEVIYYLDHPEKFVTEAHRVLKPGGQLLISSANNTAKILHDMRTLLRKFGIGRMYFNDPVRDFFTAKKLEALLGDGNFNVVENQKIILFPFSSFHRINRILEKTPFKHLGIFILLRAEKL